MKYASFILKIFIYHLELLFIRILKINLNQIMKKFDNVQYHVSFNLNCSISI